MQTDELIGTVLDHRYRIERKLGEGGMGMVYAGEHVRTGRRCAVKLLPPEASQDPEAVQRFEREARVLGTLGHPGIVGIHDFSETPDGRPYFVMDRLEGEDLSCRLARVGPLNWEDTRKIVDEISAALWAAHQAGVLHRDLKPGNVFLARSPAAPERVVLLDFGLAKGGITSALTLTQSNMVMGTPLYMSPEQARSVGVDARSDIYSLAALTFELLAGQPPFIGPNYTAVLASMLTDPAPKLSEKAAAAVPEYLDEVLDIALSKMPEDRQPDVASFATAVLQRRPAWADTTVAAIESGSIPQAGVGVATGPPSTGAITDPVSARTVRSDVDVADSASLQLAHTVASSPPMAPPAAVDSEPPVLPTAASEPALPRASMPELNITPAPAVVPQVTVDPAPTPRRRKTTERRKRPVMLMLIVALVLMGGIGAALAYWLGQRSTSREAKSGSSHAAAPVTADAESLDPAATLDGGATEGQTTDAAVAAGSPDGAANTASDLPLDQFINKQLKKATKAIEGLPKKGIKETRKVVRKIIKGVQDGPPRQASDPVSRTGGTHTSVPPRRRAAWKPPPNVKGVLALAAYMKRRDFRGCVRAGRAMPVSAQILQMTVACALRGGDWNSARTLCLKFVRKYPTAHYTRSCYSILKAYKRRLEARKKAKAKREEQKRIRERKNKIRRKLLRRRNQ